MFLNQLSKKIAFACLGLAGMASIVSCSSDDDGTPSEETIRIPAEGMDYAVSVAIQGSEGDFTYYTFPADNLMEGTLTAEGQGIEQPGYYDFTQIDQTIYSIGGLDDNNVVGISKNSEEYLVQTGDVSYQNSLSDMVKADNNTLVSVTMDAASDIITFRTFNSNSLTALSSKEVEVAQLTEVTDAGLSYSGMAVSGTHLFLSYYKSNPDTYATAYTDQAEVAVFSYPELEFQKVITDDRVGPIGGFNIKDGLTKDNQGNIYAVSHSNPANGYSQSAKPAGILKINNGETEFDEDYYFDIEEVSEGYNVLHLHYLNNGKMFAEVNVQDRTAQETWSDGPLRSVILDLNSQTLNYINGIPQHSNGGRRLPLIQEGNNVYFTVSGENGIYIYRANTQTYEAVQGAKIEANFTAGLFKI